MVYGVLLVLVAVLLGVLMWRAGIFTPAAVVAWQRIGRHHHLIDDRPLEERLGERMPSLAGFFRQSSIPRLLTIANRGEDMNTWLVKVTILTLLISVLLLAVDFVSSIFFGVLVLPPLLCLLIAAGFGILQFLALQREARHRQEAVNRAIAQALTEMAILTYGGGYTVSSALEFVARCQRDRSLLSLISGDTWQRLAAQDQTSLLLSLRPNQMLSTVTIYERIAREYDLVMFGEVATNMRRIAEKGLVPSDVLTSLSAANGQKRLAEMQVRAEQARPRLALPIGMMVLPLLSLIVYPIAVALLASFK
jgi:Type II secretion system (T2SS), protein F